MDEYKTYEQMAARAAELYRRLDNNPLDAKANAELNHLLDKMHPGGW